MSEAKSAQAVLKEIDKKTAQFQPVYDQGQRYHIMLGYILTLSIEPEETKTAKED